MKALPPWTGAPLLLALAVTVGSGLTYAEARSSFAESRGYHACVDGAEREAHLVKVDSDYFLYEHPDLRRYYLNGYAFVDGDSVPVKIACETSLSGHRLLDVAVHAGQYAGRLVEPVNVAGN